MIRMRHLLRTAMFVVTAISLSAAVRSGEKDAALSDRANTIAAIEYLGEVDCASFPESQEVLLDNIEKHEYEDVRYAAAKALFKQLQRGRRPLKPLNGWRETPDPFILEQIVRLSTFREPWTFDELNEKYADRKLEKEQAKAEKTGRRDQLKGCISDRTIRVLAKVAYSKDDTDCFVEPSKRVREEAENGLLVVLGIEGFQNSLEAALAIPFVSTDPMKPTPEENPREEIDTANIQLLTQSLSSVRGPIGANIGFQGRADTANRFNLIDGITVSPKSRVWFGYQFLASQNNATIETTQSTQFRVDPFFNDLQTIQSQLNFIQATGAGLGLTSQFSTPVDVFSAPAGSSATSTADIIAANRDRLLSEFEKNATGGGGASSGVDRRFLQLGNTNLYRFGFEYAFTPDFSVGMQGQYVTPLDSSLQQPDTFSNPLILLKHVLYRDDHQVLAGLLGVSPQIPENQIAILERTSRISPGLLYFRQSEANDRWFMQLGSAFSLPTKQDNTHTWDWATGLGYWLYRHESLINPDVLADDGDWLLGIVPQFEVLGKHIIGDSTVRGAFGLSSAAPSTIRPENSTSAFQPVASSLTDASGTLVFTPGSMSAGTLVTDAAFSFEEPRHVVDITAAVAFLFRHNVIFSSGLSIPVTGGNARSLEYLSSLQYRF